MPRDHCEKEKSTRSLYPPVSRRLKRDLFLGMPQLLTLTPRLLRSSPAANLNLARAQFSGSGCSRRRLGSSAARRPAVLGLRAEDVQRVWERRSPLSPGHVKELIDRDGVQVVVQKSEKRVWRDEEYQRVSVPPGPVKQARRSIHGALGICFAGLSSTLSRAYSSRQGNGSR